MNLLRWLNENVKHYKYIGQAGNGEKKYEESNLKCRIEEKDTIVQNETGALIVAKGSLFCLNKIANKDKFEYNNKSYEIINVNEYKDKVGRINHYEGVFK